jgi:two-component system chemotaxis sensor kinase CheA
MDDQLVKEFLVESQENLEQLDRDLVALEKNNRDQDRLKSIFRTIHTIKGTCGFFGFSKLESLTHVGENLLSRMRDGILLLDPNRTNALLALVDAIRIMLESIEKTGADGTCDYFDLIDRLTQLQAPTEHDPVSAAPATLPPSAPVLSPAAPPKPAEQPMKPAPAAEAESSQPHPAPDCLQRLAALKASGSEWATVVEESLGAIEKKNAGDPRDLGDIIAAATNLRLTDSKSQQEENNPRLAEGTIRVDVGLLDKLMNLVGELVLARNQILQFNASQQDAAFLSTSQRLNLITTELQEGVMKTRMQPIGNVWNRFPRVVRDLAVACGKQVRIELKGKETELDKTIIEAIKDPLTHIVRNSVDHGIEKPEVRVANGKAAEGQLLLRAYHEGGQVIIEICDDGGGINVERVKQKALQSGLIARDQAERMSERELLNLIFLPGFSTAERITNVSGRGVGMDVVKTNIEKIGGTVDIQSQLGNGTMLKIKIPLTLAIIPALMVTSGGDRYAIPQVSLLELVRLEGEQARKGIEFIHGAPVYRLRGNLLPLVYLDKELEVENVAGRADQETINIVVLQADERQFGLVVDRINDTEEIVVKPLSSQLKGLNVYAGATIMGDGRVALILDVLGIAQKASVVAEVQNRSLADKDRKKREEQVKAQSYLLCQLGEQRRIAIPLQLVARLEEIPLDQVETAEGQEVVQYRHQILPLIRLDRVLAGESGGTAEQSTLQVVVHATQGASYGIVVGRILDIVEADLEVKRMRHSAGMLGAAVIQGQVTDLIDLPEVIRLVEPADRNTAMAG